MPPANAQKRTSKAKVYAKETTLEESDIKNEHNKQPSSTAPTSSQCQNIDNAGNNDSTTVDQPKDEEEPIPNDDPDINILIPEGPYADALLAIGTQMAYPFPIDMMIKLEANRRRRLDQAAKLRSSRGTAPSHSHKVYVIVQTWHYDTDREERNTIAISASQDKANAKAITFFQQEYPKYRLRLADIRGTDELEKEAPDLWYLWGTAIFFEHQAYNDEDLFRHFSFQSVIRQLAWGVTDFNMCTCTDVRDIEEEHLNLACLDTSG